MSRQGFHWYEQQVRIRVAIFFRGRHQLESPTMLGVAVTAPAFLSQR
jgi:hypothetical protein